MTTEPWQATTGGRQQGRAFAMREDAHQTMLALGLARAREGAANAMIYATARTPGHRDFDYAEAPTQSGLHKTRPAFVCCFEHREECRPSGFTGLCNHKGPLVLP